MEYEVNQLEGRRFNSLLTIGGKIFHETHLSPLLRMEGSYSEMALEMVDAKGDRHPMLVNARERRDENGNAISIRLTVYHTADRHVYETNLRAAKSHAENELLDANQTSRLREQFIAVLGHDLRNPLGAITMGTAILKDAELEPKEQRMLKIISDSASRMSHLINDVMDFARGRLGGEMSLDLQEVDLRSALLHVVEELRTYHPTRDIKVDETSTGQVLCDPARISQLLSNLLANALVHGSPDQPVFVRFFGTEEEFKLSVSNSCDPIPEEYLKRIFEPFCREEEPKKSDGLGLGLYIAAEVAKAHRGELKVSSTKEETRFDFHMPLHSPALRP